MNEARSGMIVREKCAFIVFAGINVIMVRLVRPRLAEKCPENLKKRIASRFNFLLRDVEEIIWSLYFSRYHHKVFLKIYKKNFNQS
jgi:hypothetical protein